MKLTKKVPARTASIELDWIKPNYTTMSIRFREIRSKSKHKMDCCYWCKYRFWDGDVMALGHVKDKGNKIYCNECNDKAQQSIKDQSK